jgi:hypothetical protein
MKLSMGLKGTMLDPITIIGYLSSSKDFVDPEKRMRLQE